MGKVVETVAKAAVVVAAVATGVGLVTGAVAAGGAFAGFAAGSAAAYFSTTFVSTLVLGAVSAALTKSSAPSIAITEGTTVTSRQAIAPRRIVYGRTRVGGTIVFIQATDSNKYLHMVVTLAGHEIDAVESIYFNDDLLSLDGSGNVNSGTYSGKAKIEYKLGTSDQTAFTNLVSASGGKWTSDHRLRGIACLYIRLEYDSNVYPSGIPNITAVIRGKKVYDPRSATTAWSANPALCVANYITDSVYGIGSNYATEINETALIAAANVCDEDVSLSGGGTENRYESHGAFDSNVTPESVINQMLTSMSGKAIWSGGVWKILAGAYTAPTLVFDEDDLSGGIKVQSLVSRRETFNSIKGVFASPANNYVLTDFPSIVSDTAITADNGEQVWKDVQFPFTTSATMAQRLAKIDLLKARQQITVQLPLKLVGLKAQVGDIVGITNERMGWTSKAFEVVEMGIINGEVIGVEMSLREVASNVYDWSTSEEQAFDPAPNSDLPSAFNATSPNLDVSDTLEISAETVITKLVAMVSGTTAYFDRYEVQAKLSSDSDYINLGQATSNLFNLTNVIDGATYSVRARTINSVGIRSEWTEKSYQVIGKTVPPEDVTGFSINIVGASAYLTWNPVGDLDLSHYRIRHSPSTNGASYSNAIDVVAKVPRPGVFAAVPAMTGTYFIKAIDKIGNESLNSSEVVAIIDSIKGLNSIVTLQESPDFSGLKEECSVTDDGFLVLDTSIDFDSSTGLFDDSVGYFDGGGGFTSLSGTYYFSEIYDLGAIYTSRCTINLSIERADYVNLFDDATGNFDDRVGLFDGDANNYGDVNAILYISTTEDNPNGLEPVWTEYRQFFVGDYKARAFRFKMIVTTNSTESSPVITNLAVNIDMPDRISRGDDIVTGSSSYFVSFSPAYKETPAISIAAQNLQQGDYYEISGKSNSGFTITFKNSSGTAVSRTFDYTAIGYGELAT